VYTAYDTTSPTPRKVAIKHIVNAFVSPTDARRIYREIKVMAHFNHPNILPLVEVIKPRDPAGFSHIYLVSELMETDLHRVIHSRQDLTSDHISYFVYQTLCGLKHIHTAGVLHRDLKPSNLLVNADCTVRMCDFGLARESEPSMSAAFTEYVVTRWYRGACPGGLGGGQWQRQQQQARRRGCGELLCRCPTRRHPHPPTRPCSSFPRDSPLPVHLRMHLPSLLPLLLPLPVTTPSLLLTPLHPLHTHSRSPRGAAQRRQVQDLCGRVVRGLRARRAAAAAAPLPGRQLPAPAAARHGGAGVPLRGRPALCALRGGAQLHAAAAPI